MTSKIFSYIFTDPEIYVVNEEFTVFKFTDKRKELIWRIFNLKDSAEQLLFFKKIGLINEEIKKIILRRVKLWK